MDPIFETNRRASSGSILSAVETVDKTTLLDGDFSESPFYFTKKDTQIRKQLVIVLQKDKAHIIDAWNEQIKEHSTKTPMTTDDLSVLMEGIREYLPEQNVMPLEKAISQVQDAHSSCANFADNLIGSLNKFRDAVNSILRNHKIRPHWMFHLDNLIRNAVKQSVDILAPESSPEAEANLDFLEAQAQVDPSQTGVKNVGSNE